MHCTEIVYRSQARMGLWSVQGNTVECTGPPSMTPKYTQTPQLAVAQLVVASTRYAGAMAGRHMQTGSSAMRTHESTTPHNAQAMGRPACVAALAPGSRTARRWCARHCICARWRTCASRRPRRSPARCRSRQPPAAPGSGSGRSGPAQRRVSYVRILLAVQACMPPPCLSMASMRCRSRVGLAAFHS